MPDVPGMGRIHLVGLRVYEPEIVGLGEWRLREFIDIDKDHVREGTVRTEMKRLEVAPVSAHLSTMSYGYGLRGN
jgi:hypothetical protein